MHGQFVWYELTTPDVDAARRFYPAITGWGTQQFDKDYSMWTSGGVPIGGIFKLGPEQRSKGIPPNWMPYVETDSVDGTATRASSLGGRIVVPAQDIPGTGRFAVLQDPQGATFGIYKSNKGSQGWDGKPALGRFSWHELMTTDYKRAYDFYRQLFGWEKTTEMDMGGGNMYSMYGMRGTPFGGMYNRPPEMGQVPPFWLVYAQVKDTDKAVEAATRAGATVKQAPMDVPGGGRIAVMMDPQGATFAVHSAAPAAAAKPATRPAAKKTAAPASRPKAKAAKPRPKKAKAASRPKKKAASRKKATARKSSRKAKAKPKRRGR